MKKHLFILILFCFVCFINLKAANRYWIGTINNNWNSNGNWSATSGGAGGASTPTSADVAIFDGNGNINCTINTNINVLGFQILSGYASTVNQDIGRTIIVGSSNYIQNDGFFVGGNANIDIRGIFTLSSGVFTSTTAILYVGKRNYGWTNLTIFNHTGGTFNHNNGTTRFQPTGNNDRVFTVNTLAGNHFYDVIVDVNGGNSNTRIDVAAGDTVFSTNNLTHNDGRIDGILALEQNLIINSTAEDGSGWIIFTATNNQTYSYSSTIRPTCGIKVDKTAGDVSQAPGTTDLYCSRFAMNQGIFNAPTNLLKISNNWGWTSTNILNLTGGTFNHNNGTLRLQPQGNNGVNFPLVIPNGLHFYDIIVDVNGSNSDTRFTVANGDTLFAENNFTHNDGRIDGLCALKGNLTIDATAEDGSGWIIFTGTNNQTYSYSSTIRPTAGIKVDKTAGDVSQAPGTTDLYCSRFAMNQGIFNAPTNLLKISNNWGWTSTNILNLTGGTFNHNNGTLRLQPQGNNGVNFPLVIPNGLHFYDIIVDVNGSNSDTRFTVANGDTLFAENNFTHNDGRIDGLCALERNLTIDATAEDGSGWIIFTGTNNQTYSYSSTIRPTAGIKVDKTAGDVSQALGTTDLYCSRFDLFNGEFIAPSNLFKISNSWGWSNVNIFNHTGGTFNHNNGRIRFQPTGNNNRVFTVNTMPGDRFYNVELDINGGNVNTRINVTVGDTVYAINNLLHNDGRIDGLFALEQNLTIDNTAEDGNGWFIFLGTGNQTWSYSSTIKATSGIRVDKTSGTVSQAGGTSDLYCSRFDLFNGEFIAPSNLFKISNSWGWSNVTIFNHTGGTFNHNNGSTRFQPTGNNNRVFTVNTMPGDRFYDVTIDVNGGNVNTRITLSATDTIYTLNNLLLDDGRINTGRLFVEGNVEVNPSFTGGTAALSFVGNNAQTFDLTSAESKFNANVYFDKTTNNVTLLSACKLDNSTQQVYFNSGDLIGSTSNLVTFGNNTQVFNASNSSFVQGPVRKIGNDAFVFPTGKNDTAYAPIAITAPTNITNHFTAEYFQQTPDAIPYDRSLKDPSLEHISNCEYWILDRTSGTSNVTVTLSWDTRSCGVTDLSSLAVARWDGAQWQNHGNGSTSGTITNGTITTSAPVTSFSPFTLASTDDKQNPLPIELISFTATINANKVDLTWLTASEINNVYFTIEKSKDGTTWYKVLKTNGAGNSNQTISYYEVDFNPYNDISYYRLKQTDFNGDYEYSNIVPVKFEESNSGTINIFPNPTNAGEALQIKFNEIESEEISVVMRDMLGQEFYSKIHVNIQNGKLVGIPLEKSIPKGVYVITVTSENHIYSQRIIIK